MMMETIEMETVIAMSTTEKSATSQKDVLANERDDYEDGAAWTDGLW